VREAGRTSWRIEFDEPQPLVIGLFVRDVPGLKSRHAWLPHCAPATPRANGEGSEEAARQWDLWWDRSLSNNWNGPDQSQGQLTAMWWLPPNFESLQSVPALQGVVARHFSDARQWARDRKQEHVELMIGTPDRGPSIAAESVEVSMRRSWSPTWNGTLAGGLGHSSCGSLRSPSPERDSGNSTLTTSSSRLSY
jgi:hypothetical protein